MPLGRGLGERWGDPITTTVPPEVASSSGGPLLNENGEVIGVLSGSGGATASGDGRSYFAGIEELRRFLGDPGDSTFVALPSQTVTEMFPRTRPDQEVQW